MPTLRPARKKTAVKRGTGARARSGGARVVDKAAGHTQALSRGLAVLEALASTDGGATLTALAERIRIPAPTAHRLLATLEAAGYVQPGTQGEWLIGVRAFRVGSAFLAHRNLVVQAFPYLKRLMEDSGETANLAVVEGGQAVFIEQVQCRELMRMSAKLGARAPLHASGVGKAMLAAMDERGVAGALGRQGLGQFTPHTLTSRDALAAELARTRARGYAIDDEEHALGMRCVAATVFDENGEPWAALSLAGPTTRITEARVPTLGDLVRETASAMTTALGGQSPRREQRANDSAAKV
jgi:IclR family acetate operon transcriptional repressor